MNLVKLFELQKALDEKIVREKGLEGQDLLPKKILALQVELGELANEWQGFKMWKVNPQPKPGMLEEYVDCLHFILSIGLDMKLSNYNRSVTPLIEGDLIIQFYTLFGMKHYSYWDLVGTFLGLGELLGFTWEQIEQAYLSKNEINHKRQATGY